MARIHSGVPDFLITCAFAAAQCVVSKGICKLQLSSEFRHAAHDRFYMTKASPSPSLPWKASHRRQRPGRVISLRNNQCFQTSTRIAPVPAVFCGLLGSMLQARSVIVLVALTQPE